MEKHFVADLRHDLGSVPDNVERLTFGPTLPDVRSPAILVSDNNFSTHQITQFTALAVELAKID